MHQIETFADGFRFLEAPRWHAGALWCSDMHAGRVHRFDPVTAEPTVVVAHSGPVSGLGWTPDDRLLVVSMHDRRLMIAGDDGELHEHADLASIATFHANDMDVDAHGRAYVGNFGFDFLGGEPPRATALALVEPDGTVRAAADDVLFPNGTVITPDGRTLILAESMADRLTAFTVADDGSLSDRRVWADLPGVRPDGIGLDAEGCIWVASPARDEVLRVAEHGEIRERIPMPRRTFAVALGGSERRTLFVCIARSSSPADTEVDSGGAIVTIDVDVPGVGLP